MSKVSSMVMRNGMVWGGLLAGDFLAVHIQVAGAAFTEAGCVGLEVEDDSVLAGREGLRAFPAVAGEVHML